MSATWVPRGQRRRPRAAWRGAAPRSRPPRRRDDTPHDSSRRGRGRAGRRRARDPEPRHRGAAGLPRRPLAARGRRPDEHRPRAALVAGRRAAASRRCSATCTSSGPDARSRAHPRLRVRDGKARLVLPPLPRHGRVSVRGLAGAAPVVGHDPRPAPAPDLALRLLGPGDGARRGPVQRPRRGVGASAATSARRQSSRSDRTAPFRRPRASACPPAQTVRLDVPVTLAAARNDRRGAPGDRAPGRRPVERQREPRRRARRLPGRGDADGRERRRLRRAAEPERLRRAERGLGHAGERRPDGEQRRRAAAPARADLLQQGGVHRQRPDAVLRADGAAGPARRRDDRRDVAVDLRADPDGRHRALRRRPRATSSAPTASRTCAGPRRRTR